MACGSCSSGGGCSPAGCKSNGGCSSGGCNRLNVFDWLSDMDAPVNGEAFNVVEVRFKGARKEFFRNINNLHLTTGDQVVVDVTNGYHIGTVSLKGELVRLQMLKKKVSNNDEIKPILRLATERDLEKLAEVREHEGGTMYKARSIIQQLNMKMKLSDVEYQADKSKATFFYSADDRVDFRDLIKKLAEEFKIRIEMRQISLRHEAGRLGGIGSCGRELCCSTWLSDFKSVSTTAARYQNLSLNPSKLSGQCGRLKCCLNYELETYMDALKDIPNVSKPLQTSRGEAMLQKTDIFRKIMWFGFRGDNNWYPVPVERVQEIMAINSKGELVEYLVPEVKSEKVKEPEFVDNLEGDLDELANKYKGKTKKRRKKKTGTGKDKDRPAPMLADGNGVPPTPAAQGAGNMHPSPDKPRREPRNRPGQRPQPANREQSQSGQQQANQRKPNSGKPRGNNRNNQPNKPKPEGNR